APPCVVGKTVIINGGAAQRSRVTTIEVDFDQVVTLPAAPETAFQLQQQGSGNLVGLTAAVDNSSGKSKVTLTFTGALWDLGPLQDGRFDLPVFASKVSGTGGQLDGDCNGVGGDNFVLMTTPNPTLPPVGIFRFFGDRDGDGDTDAANFLSFRNVFLG